MSFLKSIHRKPRKLFKLLYWNFFFGYLPIALLQGVLALFGISSMTFNSELLIGIVGFLTAIFIAPLLVLLVTMVVWFYFTLGHFVISILLKTGVFRRL